MTTVEGQVNAALQSHLPSGMVNHRHRLAIDRHLLPYYGRPSEAEAPYIYRSQAKAGTTSFLAYATVYVIRAHRRVTLAIHAVRRGETAVGSVRCPMVVVCRYRNGAHGKHGIQYLFYVVYRANVALSQVPRPLRH